MTHYPSISPKDKAVVEEAWGIMMSLANRSTHPKLKSSFAHWGMMLREVLAQNKT